MFQGRKNKYIFPNKKRNISNILFAGIAIVLVIATFFVIGTYTDSKNPLKPQIAMIPIRGEISAEDSSGMFSSNIARSEDVIQQIEYAKNDHNVKAIILEINSPGGSVVATREIARAIDEFEKPKIAWMRESATSGAYWIASSCDLIVSDPATITGSIGVTSSYLEFSELMYNYGINYERLVSGQYKDMGSPYRELSTSERKILQNKIDTINELFIYQIQMHRNLTEEEARKVATGEIFLGLEAKDLGLIDVLGGKGEAIDLAETMANIENAQTVSYRKKESTLMRLLSYMGVSSYEVGRGIGDSLNPITSNSNNMLKIKV